MCIIFLIAYGNNSLPGNYKLILASNRDEFYSRPSDEAKIWKENPFIFGGRDLETNRKLGSWILLSSFFGITKIGALLNLTGEPKKINSLGRGPIVVNYINNYDINNIEYSQQLIDSDDVYNPFNFVSVELSSKNISISHCSNAPSILNTLPINTPLGFGNSPLSVPLQKVNGGKEKFQTILDNYQFGEQNEFVEKLMELLQCSEKFWPDDELQRRAPNWAEKLSSIYVKMQEAGYGSRTRTVILIDKNNKMDFYEETMLTENPDGEWKKTHISRQL